MTKKVFVAQAVLTLMAATASAPEARLFLQAAAKNMGADNVTTIQLSTA